MVNELSWDDIFFYWKIAVERYSYHSYYDIFTEISVTPHSNQNLQISNEILDWWPTVEINHRKNILNERGILGVIWETKTGLIRTAEMLWDHKDDKEKLALIWISAGLNGIDSDLPEEWRGETFRYISKVRGIVNLEKRNRGMYTWHGSVKNFLPETINKHMGLYSKPSELHNLMEIIALDYIVSRNNWSIVKVTREEDCFV